MSDKEREKLEMNRRRLRQLTETTQRNREGLQFFKPCEEERLLELRDKLKAMKRKNPFGAVGKYNESEV